MPARKKKAAVPRKPSAPAPRKPKARTTPARRRPDGVPGLLQELGFLRVALLGMALLVMLGAPKPGTPAMLEGPAVWTSVLAPTFAPILLMVLLLDALMGRVLLGSAQKEAERARYRRIVMVNLTAALVMVLWWLPYFLTLFSSN